MVITDKIEYNGNENGSPWLIYKYPGEKFAAGASLIVKHGQQAVIFTEGNVCNSFHPGTYILNAEYLLENSNSTAPSSDIKTLFQAEIFFINVSSKLDMGW